MCAGASPVKSDISPRVRRMVLFLICGTLSIPLGLPVIAQEPARQRVFRLEDLTAAYALIMNTNSAAHWAAQWWTAFAVGDVDESGYLLADPNLWRDDDEPPERALIEFVSPTGTGGYEFMRTMSDEERGQAILELGFTDFVLNLVAFASDEAAENVRRLRGDSSEGTLRARRQMEAIVKALGS